MNEKDVSKYNYYNSILGSKMSEKELKEKYEFWKKHLFNNKEFDKKVEDYCACGNFTIFSEDLMRYCTDKNNRIRDGFFITDIYAGHINKNINDLIIFKLDESFEEELNKKHIELILPFNNIYIDTLIKFDDGKSLYRINGFVLKKCKNHFEIFYIISDQILDVQYPVTMPFKDFYSFDFPVDDKFFPDVGEHVKKKVKNVLTNLMDKINTKQYSEYYKIENNKYVKKEIVYASKKSYKMHFWKDSGRYINIYSMNNKELFKNGYGIDELVFRGNELRNNVPYKIIDEQHKEKEKKNKILDLRRKRVWRQEEKIYKIIREIYPEKIIRRHDRKTLKGIELDFNLPELRLGIEYDGEQHFDKELYEKLYGEGFEAQVKRDRKKDRLCIKKNIKLIRIKYDYKINKTSIKKLINTK